MTTTHEDAARTRIECETCHALAWVESVSIDGTVAYRVPRGWWRLRAGNGRLVCSRECAERFLRSKRAL